MVGLVRGLLIASLFLGVSKAGNWAPSDACTIGQMYLALQSSDVNQTCGDTLVMASVETQPMFLKYGQADELKRYTLLLVDPDADNSTESSDSTESNVKFFLHWLLRSIPGKDLKSGDFVVLDDDETPPSYEEEMSYVPPHPPVGAGPHRYQVFIYEQPNEKLIGVPDKVRTGFSVDTFARVNSFDTPKAAFQFLVENLG